MKKHSITKITIALTFFILGYKPVFAQQNVQFTQYFSNTMTVNPAFAGHKETWVLQTALRSQWTGLEGAPKTGQLSVDGIVDPKSKRMGLGFQLTADKIGPQSTVSAMANFAYKLRLNDDDSKRLSFGLAFGVTNYGLDGTQLNTVDQGDMSLPTGQLNSYVPDARFGVYYNTPKFYIGGSVMDLLSGSGKEKVFRYNEGTSANLNHTRYIYIMAGMLNELSEQVKLRPSVLIREDFTGPSNLDLGAMFIFKDKFLLGGSYRTAFNLWDKAYKQDASLSNINSISGVAQFYVNNKIRLGYSYDYLLNDLGRTQGSTHEITIGVTLSKQASSSIIPNFF